MAAGVRPNIDLARHTGLRCDRGVLVDDTMQTYDPSIYAVGECVQHRNLTFGLVAPLWEQARVCAAHLAEVGTARYRASLPATHLKVTGVDLYSAGDFLGGEASEAIVLRDPKRGVYKRLVIRDNKLRGAVLFGDASDASWYFDMISTGSDIGPRARHPAVRSGRNDRSRPDDVPVLRRGLRRSRPPRRHGVEDRAAIREHPANAGRLCSKGSALGETLGLEGRLLHPSIRGEARELGRCAGRVASGFSRIIREHGPGRGRASMSRASC